MEIGDILIRRGLLTSIQGDQVRQQCNGKRFDQAVIDMGILTEEETLRALADELGMKFVELKNFSVDHDLLSQFPTSTIYRHSLLPLRRDNGRVEVATSDPFDLEALDELGAVSGLRLDPVLARRDDVVQRIKQNLGGGGDTINELVQQKMDEDEDYLAEASRADGELADMAQQASVIRLVNELLLEALEQQASDVHIEPGERGLSIRYRVDGLLRVQPMPPEVNQFYAAIVTRLKIMSRLNIAEKRLPQDGRIELRVAGRDIDVRVSIIPMLYGEGVVLRILDKGRMLFDLHSMGMPDEIYDPFGRMIRLPHGIVLVTGPTGSGKSTTLYSALSEIRNPTTKIITVEDPVEYQLDGIGQIQVHSRIGLTFAHGLRSILRHDPDVILIGEIRDYETVSSTIEGVMAQRLVRRLCQHCRESYRPDPNDLPKDFPNRDVEQQWRAVGCRECRDTGYSGRIGVYELLVTDDEVREMCVNRLSATRIRKYGIEHNMLTLRNCGWIHAMNGVTSVDDVLRVTKGDIV